MKVILNNIRLFQKQIREEHISAFAAQAAYFTLFSFVPFVMLLLALVPYTVLEEEMILYWILQILPQENQLQSFIRSIVEEVYGRSGAMLPISVVLALWAAGRGVMALGDGMDAIYHLDGSAGYFKKRIRASFHTLVFFVAIVSGLILLVFGKTIQNLITTYIPIVGRITAIILNMRALISVVLFIIVFAMIYRFVPNRKCSIRTQIPGAIFSAVAWSGFSLGFSIYIDVYRAFSNMYGSLTTLILIMLWLYICMYIILLGAKINVFIEQKYGTISNMFHRKKQEKKL